MDHFELYRQYTRPSLADLLELLHLQYDYQSAEGDLIRGKDPAGKEVEVIDFLGGFGSTILGHNHPEILKALKHLQDTKAVFHAQASVRGGAAELAFKLNQILQQETGETRRFIMTAGNSGAEAVEIAIKHSLLEWQNKKNEFVLTLKALFYNKSLEAQEKSILKKFIEQLEEAEPSILAFEGGFHGKTAAAVSVTENSSYSKMYLRKTLHVEFIKKDLTENEISRLISQFDLSLDFHGQKFYFSRLTGLIFEPIQGEGGIHPLSTNLLAALALTLKQRKIPIIADEIQSGLYRTGAFMASTAMGLKPDYILFGKSLGGALGKISATLIAEDHYQEEFGWVHTSTFAEDEWSSRLALTTLEVLQKNRDEITEKAQKFENQIRIIAKNLQMQFPQLIKAVRGRGFFMGLEFNFDEKTLHSSFLHFIYENGYATYLFVSYLLHQHQIRVGVTMSAPATLRFEPSIYISDKALKQLEKALSELCQLLSERKMAAMMNHLWKKPQPSSSLILVSEPATAKIPRSQEIPRIGFLTHVMNVDWIRRMERAFTHVESSELERFLDLYLRNSSPALFHEQLVEGKNGEKVILNLYGLMTASHQFEADLRQHTRKTFYKIQEAVDLAAEDGCRYMGLGQFTSIVSQNGLLLKPTTVLTTGNSLTAGMAFRAVQKVVKDRFQSRPGLKIGVVGFAGNICHVVAQLLADLNYPMTLVYREPYATSEKFKAAVKSLLSSSPIRMEQLTFAHQIEAVKDCDIVLLGTNSSKEFVRTEHIKSGAVILDISVPSNVHPEVIKRDDVLYFQGGYARFPFDQKLGHMWAPSFGSKNWHACLSETLVCGLLKIEESFSLGALSKERVLQSLRLADSVGVELGDLRRA